MGTNGQVTFEDYTDKINNVSSVTSKIRRSFVHLDAENFNHFYIALVRTHLEYENGI